MNEFLARIFVGMTTLVDRVAERKEERGASMVEYALLVALIAVFALVAVQLLGTRVSSIFDRIANALV